VAEVGGKRDDTRLDFRLLGPFQVVRGSDVLDLGSPQQRAVLAVLALEAGRVVSRDALIERLWPDEPPSSATGTLQAYVSQLRRVLEPDRAPRTPASVLITRDPGYLLAVDADQVDATRFTAALSAARACLAAREPAAAEPILEAALREWREDPLPEFRDAGFAAVAVARLRETRAEIGEELAAAWLAMGRNAPVITAVRRMLERQPFRERLWAQLMIALYREGRQAEALDAYRRAQTVLAEELGLEPNPSLQQLEESILRQDPSLDLVLAPARPPAVASAAPDGFVGRAEQLDLISRLVAGGGGGLVLIVGEAGVGKTSLTHAAIQAATAHGSRAAWGRCTESGTTPAFWPWLQIVRALDVDGADEVAALLSGDAHPDGDPDAARFRLYERVVQLLRVAAAGGPLIIVVDDLHAADAASLQLLAHVGAHDPPALIIAAMRPQPDASPVLQDTLGVLAREPSFHRLAVRPFTVGEVQQFLATASDRVTDAGAIEALHERTGGNPFYLKELLRLLESDHPSGWDPRTVSDSLVPEGVRDVIRQRVARLPEETQVLLRAAAVIGRDVDLTVLEVTTHLDGEQVLATVEPAVAVGLVAEGAGEWEYRFTHALVQETIYAGLPRVERARLHRRVGEALEVVSDPSDARRLGPMAEHFAKAARVGAADKAVEYAAAAAAHASSQLALDDAVTYLELALASLDSYTTQSSRTRYELLVELGKAKRATGDVLAAREVLDRAIALAIDLDDHLAVIDAATVFGGVTLWNWRAFGVVDEAMVAILEDQLDWLGDRDPRRRAALLGTLAVELYYGDRRPDGQRYAVEAVQLARRHGDVALRARTLNNLFIASWQPDLHEPAEAALEEMLGLGTLARSVEVTARLHRTIGHLRRGDLAALDADLTRCEALIEEARLPELRAQVTFARAGQTLLAERWDDADRLISAAFDEHSRLSLWGAHWVRLMLTFTGERARGRGGEMTDELARWSTEPGYESLAATAVLAALEAGDETRARQLLPRVDFDVRPSWASSWFTAQLGMIAARLGRPECEAIYDDLLPYQDDLTTMGTGGVTWGSMHLVLAELAARLGDGPAAREHARAASAAHERLGVPHLVERSRRLVETLESTTDAPLRRRA
jgi:DNA-binding SARP family transcriptional activator